MINEQCDGKSQSPIDIIENTVSLIHTLKKIELASGWDTSSLQDSTTFKLENKGYTVQLYIDSSSNINSTQNGKSFHEQSSSTR